MFTIKLVESQGATHLPNKTTTLVVVNATNVSDILSSPLGAKLQALVKAKNTKSQLINSKSTFFVLIETIPAISIADANLIVKSSIDKDLIALNQVVSANNVNTKRANKVNKDDLDQGIAPLYTYHSIGATDIEATDYSSDVIVVNGERVNTYVIR